MKIVTLKRRAEFQRVRGGGRYSAAGFLIEWRQRGTEAVAKSGEISGPRFGFTVTRKLGNAVTRNKIRRRLKSALQELLPHVPCGPFDFVVLARKPALDLPFLSLKSDMEKALRRSAASRPTGPKNA